MKERVRTHRREESVMQSKDFYATTPQVLGEVAQQLLQYAQKIRLWLFVGTLGVGKTALITALCQKLGTQEAITSPTFSIFHLYETAPTPIAHVDLYRIQHEKDLYPLDLEEYMYSSHTYCFVEWADRFLSFFSPPYLLIQGSILAQEKRKFSCKIYE